MDLVTLTVATEKLEFRCNAQLTDFERTAAIERLTRLTHANPEIVRIYVDVERHPLPNQSSTFVAKGQIEVGEPDLLASVANENALACIEFLVENFDRQLRRRRQRRQVRVSLRAPASVSGLS